MPALRPRSIATSTRVPGGNPLLLQGLVVLVDHHDRGRFLDGRPRRRPGSDGDTGACRGLGPIAWHDGDTDSRSPDATGKASGHVDRRGHDEHGSEARRGEHDRQMIDGRRHPHHRTGRIEHAGWEVGILPPRRHGAHERRRQPGHERGRRCSDEERRRPSEPPPRCPTRQRHDISAAGRDRARRAVSARTTPAGGSTSSSITQPVTRRPCSGTRTGDPIVTTPSSRAGTK